MKVKWGLMVTEGRGKLGGHVASKNRASAYFRTKVTPVNPQSTAQNTVRSRLTTRAQAWKGLSAANRAAWNAAVGDFQKTNIFGDTVSPSGFNLYCMLNNNLLAAGQSAIAAPPIPEAVNDIIIGALTVAAGAGTVSLAYTAGSAGSTILLFATAPVSSWSQLCKKSIPFNWFLCF